MSTNTCTACKRNIDEAETNYAVSALDGIFHAECFRCTVCEDVFVLLLLS